MTPTTADLYLRKSTEDQGKSAGDQEKDARVDCTEQGWAVGQVFADPASSASRYARRDRPDFAALVEHIRAGACQVLVIWETSRWTREVEEGAKLLKLCRQKGVLIRVVSANRTYDVRNRADWRQLVNEVVDAADESEKTSERTRRGLRMAAAEGKPTGHTPYGYIRRYDERGKFAEQAAHPDQARIVHRIFASLDAGLPLTALARQLNEQGVPAPLGGTWRGSTVQKLAINQRYLGLRVHNGAVVGPAQWPALVDQEQFDRVNNRLADPARRTQRGTALKWYLSGVPRCGRCLTSRLRTWKQAGGTRRYVCPDCMGSAIQADALDELIGKLVVARLRRPDIASLLAKGDDAEIDRARTELSELTDQLEEYRTLVAARKLSPAGLVPVEAALLPQIESAQQKLRELSRPTPLAALAASEVAERWASLPPAIRRDVTLALVDIVVGPATPGRNWFDPARLGCSRWVGSELTWAEELDG